MFGAWSCRLGGWGGSDKHLKKTNSNTNIWCKSDSITLARPESFLKQETRCLQIKRAAGKFSFISHREQRRVISVRMSSPTQYLWMDTIKKAYIFCFSVCFDCRELPFYLLWKKRKMFLLMGSSSHRQNICKDSSHHCQLKNGLAANIRRVLSGQIRLQ